MSKANASHTLMSGRSIFAVQDVGNLPARQMQCAGQFRTNEREGNPIAFHSAAVLGRCNIARDGNGRTFGQRNTAVQDHDAVLYMPMNYHVTILARSSTEQYATGSRLLTFAGGRDLVHRGREFFEVVEACLFVVAAEPGFV